MLRLAFRTLASEQRLRDLESQRKRLTQTVCRLETSALENKKRTDALAARNLILEERLMERIPTNADSFTRKIMALEDALRFELLVIMISNSRQWYAQN